MSLMPLIILAVIFLASLVVIFPLPLDLIKGFLSKN
jgi:hypothetical protein